MNNNGERIKNYNNTFLGYLNSIVTDLNPESESTSNRINNTTNNFRNSLLNENLDIAEEGTKTLIKNGLNEYVKVLMTYFDNSGVHRIDESHENNEDINKEVSDVTTTLAEAVSKMNKLPEFLNLISRIKATLTNYFVQHFPNVENVKEKAENCIDTYVIALFNQLVSEKIDIFHKNILPNIISIGDSIHFQREITHEEIQEEILRGNEERDRFIASTMDVEIKEEFENGVVKLTVTDQMGKTNVYEGREAMERLISYNQLFEASRPGRKVDISNWEHLLKEMNEEDKRNTLSTPSENLNTNPTFDNTQGPNQDLTQNLNLSSNENVSYQQEFNQATTGFTNTNDSFATANNDLTSTNTFINFDDNDDEPIQESNNQTFSSNPFEDAVKTNDTSSEELPDEEMLELKAKLGIKYQSNDGSINTFNFLPNYANPNQERDDFILKATGIIIDEDIDNNGALYLKVKEPIGREQIYTGREAVNMIKKYNKTFLDANPDKHVDTSLIDKFED